MVSTPGVAARSDHPVGGFLIAGGFSVSDDPALVLERQRSGFAGLACGFRRLCEGGDSGPVIRFVLGPAGAIERPPLLELSCGAADYGGTARFDAAQVSDEQSLARSCSPYSALNLTVR